MRTFGIVKNKRNEKKEKNVSRKSKAHGKFENPTGI